MFWKVVVAVVVLGALVFPSRVKVDLVPPHCIKITGFDRPGRRDVHGGWKWDGVHGIVQPFPECWKYRENEFLRIENGKLSGE